MFPSNRSPLQKKKLQKETNTVGKIYSNWPTEIDLSFCFLPSSLFRLWSTRLREKKRGEIAKKPVKAKKKKMKRKKKRQKGEKKKMLQLNRLRCFYAKVRLSEITFGNAGKKKRQNEMQVNVSQRRCTSRRRARMCVCVCVRALKAGVSPPRL